MFEGKHSDLTEKVIKAFYKVYAVLGYGFNEKVYENALVIELRKAGLFAEPQKKIQVYYEGELVAIIGKAGRYIAKEKALEHVAGYSICNDASIRDYQFKSAQWTIGKNFDNTGPFGPVFVTSDELPPGATGLKIQTRLNGVVVQDASTASLIFDVATLVSQLSEAVNLQPGDVIVTGTPSGVGLARKLPLWMKHGDVCEVEIEGIGILRSPIVDEK